MDNGTKINQLLQQLPIGSVLLSSWLMGQGYPYELQQRYRKSGWLISIGKGAMVRNGQKLLLNGAIFALQQQFGAHIHIGGRTALGILGFAHNIEVDRKETLLFATRGIKLPVWLKNNVWDTKPVLINTSFLPTDTGIVDLEEADLTIQISGAARAMLECLELAPDRFDLTEARDIMEGLNQLKPDIVQNLLEQCSSIKTKRLFLYFAEKANHSWFTSLQLEKINLGSGNRSIVQGGVLIPKYQIIIPKNLI